MSDALAHKPQSAYQRWEMASFDTPQPAPLQPGGESAPSSVEALTQAAHDLAGARERALEQGRADGFEAGRAAGFVAGLDQGSARAALESMQLQALLSSFGAAGAQSEARIAAELLDLALELARAMLKSALALRPELVLPVVAEAVRYLPSLQQPALLFLHPDDALLIRDRMGGELDAAGWRLVDDAQLERGGCRVETASNQIDGSLATRWQRLAMALGRNSDWLAP